MPIHDWARVDAGLFHAFHQDWIGVLARALNTGGLPPGYFALREQSTRGPVPDVLTLELPSGGDAPDETGCGVSVAIAPPRTRVVRRAEDLIYVRKADRISIRHRHGQIVAIIEIVSPGNKASKNELRAFVEKTSKLIAQGVHQLVIDLLPPTKRDPQGIHKAIWDEFLEEDFELPADKPLTLASYDAGPPPAAYVEPIAVGDTLPNMPLFLKPDFYIPAPLETTYRTTWDEFFPAPMKRLLEAPGERPPGDSRFGQAE
ncbi:MAG: DUF4058 family protein [Isosphaeraceae bacterium]